MARQFIQRPKNRRGITAVLAMIYLALFATLAVGFFASVSTSVQVAKNERDGSRALLAAESGMHFTKYHLANLDIPSNTATAQLFAEVFNRLGTRVNNTTNLPTGAKTITMSAGNDLISMPSGTDNWISIDGSGMEFRATIEPEQNGQKLLVKSYGRYKTNTNIHPVQLEYALAQDASKVFNFGVASRSSIVMSGNVSIRGTPGNEVMGSVLSTTMSTNVPLTMSGNAKISGDASFVNASAAPSFSGNVTIAGYAPSSGSFSAHVHKGVDDPDFPTVDTSDFMPFVPDASAPAGAQVITTSNPSGSTFKNIRIKANANPTFSGNTTINGVVYIETPNKVKFSGNLTLKGAIVVQTDSSNNASLNLANNTIDFSGNVSATGVETLPATSDFPASLRALTGAMLLAPGFEAKMSGNFGTVSGSIIASKLTFSGNAGGTVKGTVMNLRDTAFALSGNSDIIIQSQATQNYPAGVRFSAHYMPLPATYTEGQ